MTSKRFCAAGANSLYCGQQKHISPVSILQGNVSIFLDAPPSGVHPNNLTNASFQSREGA